MSVLARLPAPHLLAAGLCLGLSASLAIRGSSALVGILALLFGVAALLEPRGRAAALTVALALGGWWWGSLRLDSLDESVLAAEIGRAGPVLVESTGPARRSPFEVRLPVRVLRFEGRVLDEPARLDLPPGRAPPQGAVLSVVAELKRPEGPQDGFDERAYLARQGVHVILAASSFRIEGHRGGIGGLADRLRSQIAGTLAPGITGERRAVVAGVVLGEDEGLDQGLRDGFRA